MTKRLRCYLGFHRWQQLRKDARAGGGWYKECRDCGKFVDIPPPPPPLADAGGGGGMI